MLMVLCCAALPAVLCCAAVCQIVLLSSLKTFVVASNKFSGTVNENIYYLPALAKLDLSNNTLVGTTPQAIGCVWLARVACMHRCSLAGPQAAASMPLLGLSKGLDVCVLAPQALAVCLRQ